MTDTAQYEILTAMYFGGDDPEIISYVDQFINGLHRFAGLFTSSESPDELGQIVLTMPQKLHRHLGLNIFVGPTSITKELLFRRNFANDERITGRTLHKKAKEVVATCKKMMALVTGPGSPYRDGTFPSGTNWDDYILWCLVAMQNECDRDAPKAKEPARSAAASTCGDEAEVQAPVVANVNDEEEDTTSATTRIGFGSTNSMSRTFPAGAFFKPGVGFLAWALWGHIPLQDGENMQSTLFGEVKANTSFGRGTSTRSAMRKAVIAANAAPVDNRRGKKREVEDIDSNVQPAAASGDAAELALLAKTLEHLTDEAMEKEESKNHYLRVRLVRDKLTSRRRRSEVFLQRLNLSSKNKKKPDTSLFDKMDANEDEIENLEKELVILQEEECRRHSERMEKKRREISSAASIAATTITGMTPMMIAASGSFESATSGIESSSGNDSGGNEATTTPYNNGNDWTRNDGTPNVMTPDIMTCMECNMIPTNHTCLKCKQVRVCACCCDENRELRNIIWCKGCFENETPALQEIIRNGDYNYK